MRSGTGGSGEPAVRSAPKNSISGPVGFNGAIFRQKVGGNRRREESAGEARPIVHVFQNI